MDRGSDAVGLFVTAVETSIAFRIALNSSDKDGIARALAGAGIVLPEPHHAAFIDACVDVHDLDAWLAMDRVRSALMQEQAGIQG